MKHLLHLCLIASASMLSASGCSSSSDAPSHTISDKDASVDAPEKETGTDATAESDAAPSCEEVDGTIFAADAFYFGEMDWEGHLDDSAWMLFGANVDGMKSTASSTNLCQPAAGANAASVYPDGDDGVDNAFGKTVLPLLLTLSSDFPDRVNASVSSGDFTWLLKLDPYTGQANQSSVDVKVYAGDTLPHAPLFDGADCWPIAPASLEDESDIESAKISFSDCEIVAHELTTSSGDIELAVPLAGTSLTLTAHHAKIFIEFANEPGVPSKGIIAGVLDTEEFIEEARDVMGFLDPTMCSGATFEAVATAIRQASDIMKDGSQDPSSTCDGISVGIGFTIGEAGYGGLGSAQPVPTDPCP